jgi:hypothetical protein
MTWNDFCWNDWEGVSCGYTAVVIVVVILALIALVIKVIVRAVGWPRWLRRSGAAMADIYQRWLRRSGAATTDIYQPVTNQDVDRAHTRAVRAVFVWALMWVLFFVSSVMQRPGGTDLASAIAAFSVPAGIIALFVMLRSLRARKRLLNRYQHQLDIEAAIRSSKGEQS